MQIRQVMKRAVYSPARMSQAEPTPSSALSGTFSRKREKGNKKRRGKPRRSEFDNKTDQRE
jgi:hypothetical protein